MNTNIESKGEIDLSVFDFQAQFRKCEAWNDPDQWDALGMLYYQRGYMLNAIYCFKRADMCRETYVVAVETEA